MTSGIVCCGEFATPGRIGMMVAEEFINFIARLLASPQQCVNNGSFYSSFHAFDV